MYSIHTHYTAYVQCTNTHYTAYVHTILHYACIDDATSASAIILRFLQNTPKLLNQLGWNSQGWFHIIQTNFFDNLSSISPLA